MKSWKGKKKNDQGESTMLKRLAALTIALGLFALQALPALACGALVAPNGSVRLSRETHPVVRTLGAETAAAPSDSATVLQKVKIEALNITVIKGNGQEVLNWATSNDFFLNTETKDHLLAYAKGSPIFLAAKYDT